MSTRDHQSELAPFEFLQLAGHPLRWRLLTALARSDRLVHELTALVGETQNLVSYHLAKLRERGLVFARRSSADRRDTYYSLDLVRIGGLLSTAGGTLHPGLRLAPPSREHLVMTPVRVLFLCTGNSARSQMAEAFARAGSGGALEAYSAGSKPKPVHSHAVRVMREAYDLDLSGHASKHLDVFAGQHFDWVITLCDRVREVCPQWPDRTEAVHWSLPNPDTGDSGNDASYPLFRQTAAELASRIGFLLAVINDRTTAPDDGAKEKP